MFRLPKTNDSLYVIPKIVARIGVVIASNYVAQATADAIIKDNPESTARVTAGAIAGYSSAMAFNVGVGYVTDVAIDAIGDQITKGKNEEIEVIEEETEDPAKS